MEFKISWRQPSTKIESLENLTHKIFLPQKFPCLRYLLERIVCAKGVFKVAVLKVIALEETMIPTDVGVTGTVERQ